jgi:hypothetical protein
MQLFFINRTAVGVFVVYISMVLLVDPWCMLWIRLPLTVRLINHTWITAWHITRNRSSSGEDHHLPLCNFSSVTQPPLVFLIYI